MRGGERPQFVPLNLIRLAPVREPASSSDYQDPLPGSVGYAGILRLARADASGLYVLVSEVGGCFR